MGEAGPLRRNTAGPHDVYTGDATGLVIPAHPAALVAAGPSFLTAAFQAYGWLAADNEVVRIAAVRPCAIGSTGVKSFLWVEYRMPGPATELFAKFSRNFDDPVRDRRRDELLPEIRLAELSRAVDIGVAVAEPAFADYHAASSTGLLITREIPFGRGTVEPLHHKCMDHVLADPLDHYRVIVTTLARLAARHKNGALDPHVDRLFPYSAAQAAAEDPIPWGLSELHARLDRLADFAERCPALLPAAVRSPAFLRRFAQEAAAVHAAAPAIREYLQSDRALVALSHFNGQIDNCWFWREADGSLRCGMLDWQRARQMNVAYALWGALCGISPDRFLTYLDDLLPCFAGSLRDRGGPDIEPVTLREHLLLYAATIGLAGLSDMPRIVLSQLPEAVTAAGPYDPLFARNETARSFLHCFSNLLTLWEASDVAAALRRATTWAG